MPPNKINRAHDAARMVERLPLLIRDERRSRGLSLRDAADQIGIPHTTLHRLEAGDRDYGSSVAVACLTWLGA